MAEQLFEVDGGYSDGKVYILSGAGAPGGDAGYQDDAPLGSQYTDTDNGNRWKKVTAGTGTDKWSIAVDLTSKIVDSINQTAHGFVAGDWVGLDGTGGTGYVKALGDDPANADVIGIVETVTDVDNFTIVTAGYSAIAEGSGAHGDALFLDQVTSGAHTTTKPSTGIQKNVGFNVEGFVFVAINITIDIAEDDAPGVPLIIMTDVTTITSIEGINTSDKHVCLWEVVASTADGRYVTIVQATHDGFGAAATNSDHAEFGKLKMGTTVAGLSIGTGLAGVYPDQEMILNVASTLSTEVKVRRMSA